MDLIQMICSKSVQPAEIGGDKALFEKYMQSESNLPAIAEESNKSVVSDAPYMTVLSSLT